MWGLFRYLGIVVILSLMLTACSKPQGGWGLPSADEQIAALPWPEDGLYGMTYDGYLGFLEMEDKIVELPVILVTAHNGPRELVVAEVAFETATGQIIATRGCRLIPGARTASFQVVTLSCPLEVTSIGSYRLSALRVTEKGYQWRIATGNITVEVLPGQLNPDLFVSRWHLQRDRTDEYRALLVNKGSSGLTVKALRLPGSDFRTGDTTKLQVGREYTADSGSFQEELARLSPESSVVLRVGFEHTDQTMVLLRPIAEVIDDAGQTSLMPLQTSYFAPPMSPRDILAFTKSPNHLRTIGQAITAPDSQKN